MRLDYAIRSVTVINCSDMFGQQGARCKLPLSIEYLLHQIVGKFDQTLAGGRSRGAKIVASWSEAILQKRLNALRFTFTEEK